MNFGLIFIIFCISFFVISFSDDSGGFHTPLDEAIKHERKVYKNEIRVLKKCKRYYGKNKGKRPTPTERSIAKISIIRYFKEMGKKGEKTYSQEVVDSILDYHALDDYEVFRAFFNDRDNLDKYIKIYNSNYIDSNNLEKDSKIQNVDKVIQELYFNKYKIF